MNNLTSGDKGKRGLIAFCPECESNDILWLPESDVCKCNSCNIIMDDNYWRGKHNIDFKS